MQPGRCGHRPLRRRYISPRKRATARVAPTKRSKAFGKTGRRGRRRPHDILLEKVRRGGHLCSPAGLVSHFLRCVIARAHCARGERTERCRWQRKQSERVAAVKISSVRRKAAQKFWAPQQGHRPLRILRGQGRPPLQDAGELAARTVRAIAGAFGSTPAIGWFRSISAACDDCRQHPDPSGLSRDPSPGT